MFGGLGHIIWTNIDILTLRCDFYLQCSNQFFSHNTLANDNVSPDQVWLPENQQLSRYNRKSHILIIWALTVTLTLKIATATTKFSAWHSGSWCFITIPNLVTKCSVIQKISSGHIHWDFEPSLWPWPWMQWPHFSTGHSGIWCCTTKPSLVANRPAV